MIANPTADASVKPAASVKADLYWPTLDALRAVAFLLVFFHHAGWVPSDTQFVFCNRLASFGWLGVDLFFVISGFLMTSLLISEQQRTGKVSVLDFYLRRVLRIWPAYSVVLVTVLLAIPLLDGFDFKIKAYGTFLAKIGLPLALFFGNFTLLGNIQHLVNECIRFRIGDAVTLLAPLWSLCIEEQFYIVLPVVLLLLVKSRAKLAFFVAVALISVSCRAWIMLAHPELGHDGWYRNTFAHLDPVMFGCIAACLNRDFNLSNRIKSFAPAVLASAGGAYLLFVSYFPDVTAGSPMWIWGVDLAAFIFAACVVAACALQPTRWVSPLRALGKKTYAMYLWHYFMLSRVSIALSSMKSGNAYADWATLTVLGFAATLLVAWVSWNLLEARFLRLKDKLRLQLLPSARPAQSLEMSLPRV